MYVLTNIEATLTHKVLTGPYAPSIENDLPGDELAVFKKLVTALTTAINNGLPEEPDTPDNTLPTPPPTAGQPLPTPPPTDGTPLPLPPDPSKPDNTLPTGKPDKPDNELPDHAEPKHKKS